MCDCDFYNGPDVFHEITRRARKRHRCGECRGLIAPGCHYYESRGLWDGEWGTHKTCGSCYVIAHTLLDRYCFGDMIEAIDCEYDLSERGNPGRIALAGMRRRRRAAERVLRRDVA